MRYLQSFNRRLGQIREQRRLSRWDVAQMCGVEEAQVRSWEATDDRQRSYPDVGELLDFCLKTETPLDTLIDVDDPTDGQLELPGLAFSNSDDLTVALKELEEQINRIQVSDRLSEQEGEMLRRFRNTTAENRRLILQILGG